MAMAMPAQSLEIGKPRVTMANRPAHHSRVTCAASCTAVHSVQARRARERDRRLTIHDGFVAAVCLDIARLVYAMRGIAMVVLSP